MLPWDGSNCSCDRAMEICDGAVCWPSLIHRLSSEWELVTETVSPKDISQEGLPVKVQTCCWADTHTPYLFFAQQQVTYPSMYTQAYTLTQKTVYQFDVVLRLWWQYQLFVWLRWCGPRQDGGCHLIWVRGSWDGEGLGGGKGDSWVHRMQFIPLSACVFISPFPDDHLSHPYAC